MDLRFKQEEGISIFTGNELLVKGALENRVCLQTTPPISHFLMATKLIISSPPPRCGRAHS